MKQNLKFYGDSIYSLFVVHCKTEIKNLFLSSSNQKSKLPIDDLISSLYVGVLVLFAQIHIFIKDSMLSLITCVYCSKILYFLFSNLSALFSLLQFFSHFMKPHIFLCIKILINSLFLMVLLCVFHQML